MSDIKDKIKNDYLSGITPKQLAEKYDTSLNTIKSWIKRYGWSKDKNQGAPYVIEDAPSCIQSAPLKRKQGGQPGNHNATGPPGNKNAEKHGFYSKYLPEETLSIMQEMPTDPLDILWDQIQIAYAAIIRAQNIMYVEDRDDKTKSKVEKRRGNTSGEKWEIQYAWDKQSNFLQAQARAQKTLEGMISRYEELLHKNWELATEEQKAKLQLLEAQRQSIEKTMDNDVGEGGVVIVNDIPKSDNSKTN